MTKKGREFELLLGFALERLASFCLERPIRDRLLASLSLVIGLLDAALALHSLYCNVPTFRSSSMALFFEASWRYFLNFSRSPSVDDLAAGSAHSPFPRPPLRGCAISHLPPSIAVIFEEELGESGIKILIVAGSALARIAAAESVAWGGRSFGSLSRGAG